MITAFFELKPRCIQKCKLFEINLSMYSLKCNAGKILDKYEGKPSIAKLIVTGMAMDFLCGCFVIEYIQ